MLRLRNVLMLMLVLGATAALTPTVAGASGPSAGDQQYIDPLGNSGGSHHSSTTTTTSNPTAPAPVSGSSSSTPVASTTTSTTPTATTTAAGSKTLPFTGLNVWLAGAVGIGLLTLGFGIRRAARRRA